MQKLLASAECIGSARCLRADLQIGVAMTAISASEILPRISRTVFGPLLDLPPDDQAILLETLEA